MELCSIKQTYLWRKIGFDMLKKIANAKGEEAFTNDARIIKLLLSMLSDGFSWKIRQQGAIFFRDFLKPLLDPMIAIKHIPASPSKLSRHKSSSKRKEKEEIKFFEEPRV